MCIPARVRSWPILFLAVCAACAQPASAPDPRLPDVLLIGDSVSLDYTSQVRSLLRGKANILRPVDSKTGRPINCGSTEGGLRGIEEVAGCRRVDSGRLRVLLHSWLTAARCLPAACARPQTG